MSNSVLCLDICCSQASWLHHDSSFSCDDPIGEFNTKQCLQRRSKKWRKIGKSWMLLGDTTLQISPSTFALWIVQTRSSSATSAWKGSEKFLHWFRQRHELLDPSVKSTTSTRPTATPSLCIERIQSRQLGRVRIGLRPTKCFAKLWRMVTNCGKTLWDAILSKILSKSRFYSSIF